MSNLPYYSYGVYGSSAAEALHYSQSVRIADVVHCAGQGGWNPDSPGTGQNDISESLDTEITQAFDNVESALIAAGASGWTEVYRLTSYHVAMSDDAMAIMVRELKKRCPSHKPIWTAIGVAKLAYKKMNVEIEVSAHSPAVN